jgi:hypothetical protein
MWRVTLKKFRLLFYVFSSIDSGNELNFYLNMYLNYMNSPDSVMHIKWEPPPTGTRKFNVDRAHSKRNGSSTCGRLIRDVKGDFIQGFYCNIAPIIKGLRCGVYFELCVLLVISTLIVLFFKLILLLFQLLSSIVLPPSLISNLFYKRFKIYYIFKIGKYSTLL